MATNGDSDGEFDRAPLEAAMLAATGGAVLDFGGRDAVKRGDLWDIEPDDDIDLPARTETTEWVLDHICCFHPAHYPTEAS